MDATPLESEPVDPPESRYSLDRWYTAADYARALNERPETVNAVVKCGHLPGWQKPSGRWLIPPEAVNEETWGKALRHFRTSPRSIARFCGVVFDMSPSDQVRLERVLIARAPADPMAEVVRWMMRGITADRRSVNRTTKRAVLERDESRCVYCRRKTKKPEYDHVIPVSWGGDKTEANIVVACRECNRMKRDTPAFPCRTCERLTWMVRGGMNRCGCYARP